MQHASFCGVATQRPGWIGVWKCLGPFVDAVTQVTRRTLKAASPVPRRILPISWMLQLPLNQKTQVGCWGVGQHMPELYQQGLAQRLQQQLHQRRQCEKVLVHGDAHA